jgi:DNA polymerase phi
VQGNLRYSVMSTTLPLFWHLSSSSRKERIDASLKLIRALEQFQTQFVPRNIPDSNSGSEPEVDEDDEENITNSDGLDVFNAQDVSYSIRRLVRGLASPRESSRLGFAVALTEVSTRCVPNLVWNN